MAKLSDFFRFKIAAKEASYDKTGTDLSSVDLQEAVNELNSKVNTKSVNTHTHDDRYFTESEVTTKLALKADQSTFSSHTGNASNPHGVTKSQVGLGSVPDYSASDTYTSTGTNLATRKAVYDAYTALNNGKLGLTATATNSAKLNNKTNTTASTVSTIAERDSLGDIHARLFRSEYDTTNSNVGYIMTQVDTASDNFIRPSTPAQFRSAVTDSHYLGINATAATATWADTVDVNDNNASGTWYDVVWHSGDTVYSSAGVEIQGSTNSIKSDRHYFAGTTHYLRESTGSYGTVAAYGQKGGWGGYSIEGRAVFMHDGSNSMGLYDNVNNHWAVKHTFNGSTELYYDGIVKANTTSAGLDVAGSVYENGSTLSSKYLGINSKAVDSGKLDGLNFSDFTRYKSDGSLANSLAHRAYIAGSNGSTEIDHVWHDTTSDSWNFCSRSTLKAAPNAEVRAGSFRANKGAPSSTNTSKEGYAFELDGDTGLFAVGGTSAGSSDLHLYIDDISVAKFTKTDTSKSINGYYKMPSGIIIQWGFTQPGNHLADLTETLPIAFPNAFLSLQLTSGYILGTGTGDYAGGKIVSNSQFVFRTSIDNGHHYLAIGY